MERQKMVDLPIQSAPEGWDPIQAQIELQDKISIRQAQRNGLGDAWRSDPALSLTDLTERIKDEYVNVQMELAEIIDHLPWKHWKSYKTPTKEELHELKVEITYEVVDVLHFLMNMCIALGISWEQLKDIWYTKNRENHARQDRGY